MDSFLKDVLSAIILASWVLPVAYLTLALLAGRLADLVRLVPRERKLPPPSRERRSASKPAASEVSNVDHSASIQPPVAAPTARRNPVSARGVVVPMTRLARPRVGPRWKSSQRLSVGAY